LQGELSPAVAGRYKLIGGNEAVIHQDVLRVQCLPLGLEGSQQRRGCHDSEWGSTYLSLSAGKETKGGAITCNEILTEPKRSRTFTTLIIRAGFLWRNLVFCTYLEKKGYILIFSIHGWIMFVHALLLDKTVLHEL